MVQYLNIDFVAVEVGAEMCMSLHRALPSLSRAIIRKLVDKAGKLAITASQRIFLWPGERRTGTLGKHSYISLYFF